MPGTWRVTTFGGPDASDKVADGLTFEQANRLLDDARNRGEHGMLEFEADDRIPTSLTGGKPVRSSCDP